MYFSEKNLKEINEKKYMEKYKEILEELNSCIWDYSELKFEEFKSSEKIKEILKKYDLRKIKNYLT